VAEEIWQGLTGGRSVHLQDWPDAALYPLDDELVATMDRVREIASAGLALRKARGLRVRLPLAGLTVAGTDLGGLTPFIEVLKDELNVKGVTFSDPEVQRSTWGIGQRLTVNARALGPRVGKDVQRIIQAAKAGTWSAEGGVVVVDGTPLEAGEYELEPYSADESLAVTFLPDGGLVLLDTVTTPELEAEGLARDVIRAVQDTRKAAGLDVSDRITLSISGTSEADIAALSGFAEVIAGETLATETEFAVSADPETEAALDSMTGAQRATLKAGQYANTGVLVVDVWKSGAVNV
jgi:isoleucyl-tRNA synthetase